MDKHQNGLTGERAVKTLANQLSNTTVVEEGTVPIKPSSLVESEKSKT